MFKKHKCSKCGKGLDSKANFCAHCGSRINSKEDWGMLGKDDFEKEISSPFDDLFSGFGGGMLNKMINQTMKMIEKEMNKDLNKTQQNPHSTMRLMINGQEIDLNNMQPKKEQVKKVKELKQKDLPFNKLENFSKLPRKEPETSVKRLQDKIVYEINLPNVKNEKDISIMKLENSIEIKAVSNKNSFFKIIKLSNPILSYSLEKGKLVLMLAGN